MGLGMGCVQLWSGLVCPLLRFWLVHFELLYCWAVGCGMGIVSATLGFWDWS